MKRVLAVSHSVPMFPGPGAETRAFCLAQHLSKDFDLTFLLPDYQSTSMPAIERLRAFAQVRTYPVERKWQRLEWRTRQAARRLERFRRYLPSARTPQFVYDVTAIIPSLRVALQDTEWNQVDLLHVIHPHTAHLFDGFVGSLPMTLDWIDERSQLLRRLQQLERSPAVRYALSLEIARIERHQTRISRYFSATFVSSELDALRLKRITAGSRPVVVPNGVDLSYFAASATDRPPGNGLVFAGHMSYEPNVDAVCYFVQSIMPQILAEVPDATLTIVGMAPDPAVRRLEAHYPGKVVVTGSVADVRPFLSQAAVCIVPLRSGGGTRLKILEAMAMSRPSVSTTIGCEGLLATDDHHLLIRDDPMQFAQAVIELLRHTDKWNVVARGGRDLVEQRYDWREIAEIVARVWRDVCRTKELHGGASR